MLTYRGHNFVFTRNPIQIVSALSHNVFFLIQRNFGGLAIALRTRYLYYTN